MARPGKPAAWQGGVVPSPKLCLRRRRAGDPVGPRRPSPDPPPRERLAPVAPPGCSRSPPVRARPVRRQTADGPRGGGRRSPDQDAADPPRSAPALYVDSALMILEAAASGVGIGLARARLAAADL